MANRIEFPKHLVNRTYATIRYAFDKSKDIIVEEAVMGSINISDIITYIIHDVGRFTERYASDVLYTLDNLREFCENEYLLVQDIDEIITFGIRRDGVDHGNFVMSRLMDTARGPQEPYLHADYVYRRILGVRVQVLHYSDDSPHPRIKCTLRDMTNEFLHINRADLDHGKLIHPPYENGNPIPVSPYQAQTAGKQG